MVRSSSLVSKPLDVVGVIDLRFPFNAIPIEPVQAHTSPVG